MPKLAFPRLFLVLLALVTAAIACGSSNTGEVVGQSTSATDVPPTAQRYAVGDVIRVQDHTITLNSAEVVGSTLKANFTIENTSTAEINISSLLSFSARDSQGTQLQQEIFDCGTSSLDGSVLATDKLRGDICWATTAYAPFKLYYEASFLGTGAIVWELP